MVDLDHCRAAFEKWMWEVNGVNCGHFREDKHMQYADLMVNRTWVGWREGAKWQDASETTSGEKEKQ